MVYLHLVGNIFHEMRIMCFQISQEVFRCINHQRSERNRLNVGNIDGRYLVIGGDNVFVLV